MLKSTPETRAEPQIPQNSFYHISNFYNSNYLHQSEISSHRKRRLSSCKFVQMDKACVSTYYCTGGCTMGYLKRRFRMIPIMSSTHHTSHWLRSFAVIAWITPACQPLPVAPPSYFCSLSLSLCAFVSAGIHTISESKEKYVIVFIYPSAFFTVE